jgi:hypothetical protein
VAKTFEKIADGRISGLFNRWFEPDEEAEAEIALMPDWVRPIARFSSRGFAWGIVVVPIALLVLGFLLVSGDDSATYTDAEFDSLSSCLAAVGSENPEQKLRLIDDLPSLVSGVIEPSGGNFRCETKTGDSGQRVVLERSTSEPTESFADTAVADATAQDDATWTIRNTKTMFIKPFDRTALPPDSEVARQTQSSKPQKNSKKKTEPDASIPAGTGRCIAGCANFPNGFYDIAK